MTPVVPDPDLLRGCLLAPLDAAPRLVLADWLEERGWGPIPLAILRYDFGDWSIGSAKGAVVLWTVDVMDFLSDHSGRAVVEFDFAEDDYGNRSVLKVKFERIDGMPTCGAKGCRRTTGLSVNKAGGWRCPSHGRYSKVLGATRRAQSRMPARGAEEIRPGNILALQFEGEFAVNQFAEINPDTGRVRATDRISDAVVGRFVRRREDGRADVVWNRPVSPYLVRRVTGMSEPSEV